jgi:hypothetical protein
MKYDDESLERALFALPLEEAPADLRARIMIAVAGNSVPVFQGWELWLLGFALTFATWFALAIVGSPVAGGETVAAAIREGFDGFALLVSRASQPNALLWLGIGVTAAVWFSQLTFPGRGESSEA